ncbi:MAG: hypothetical protein EP330_27570 [Deltaproteobacteria bacterium]|nr:MAG: hypothetical protein EP330_27570 [Deltaproteobacteria bacterium]
MLSMLMMMMGLAQAADLHDYAEHLYTVGPEGLELQADELAPNLALVFDNGKIADPYFVAVDLSGLDQVEKLVITPSRAGVWLDLEPRIDQTTPLRIDTSTPLLGITALEPLAIDKSTPLLTVYDAAHEDASLVVEGEWQVLVEPSMLGVYSESGL